MGSERKKHFLVGQSCKSLSVQRLTENIVLKNGATGAGCNSI